MFKFIAIFAFVAVASAAPGYITEHHVVQPAVVAKSAVVDTSASSAITHQSFTNLERKVPVVHTYEAVPTVVKTVSAPVVHHTYAAAAAPTVVKTVATPVVHSYASAPIYKSVSSPIVHSYAATAPVVHSYAAAPLVHSYAAAPVVHSTSLVHSAPVVHSVPVAYKSYH